MAYICQNPEQYEKQPIIKPGECVDLVKHCTNTTKTRPASTWREGIKVKGANIPKGTAIATFVGGKYPNNKSGQHAAIYLRQDAKAIYVVDQNRDLKFIQIREIRFNDGKGSRSNDGDAFSVID